MNVNIMFFKIDILLKFILNTFLNVLLMILYFIGYIRDRAVILASLSFSKPSISA